MSRQLPRPTVYLDGSTFRAAMSEGMRPRDRIALCRIAAMVSEDLLTFFAPAYMRAEIDRLTPAARRGHLREYAALQILRAAPAGWLDAEPSVDAAAQADYNVLLRIIGSEVDAAPLLRAREAGARDAIAVESSVLFERSRELITELDLRVFLPADYLSRWSTQLQLPK